MSLIRASSFMQSTSDTAYKAELMAAQSPAGTNVIKEVLGPCETPIIFCKHGKTSDRYRS